MQKNCGIGGQALIEGIMMRNMDKYSMAARSEDGVIHTEVRDYRSIFGRGKWTRLPIIRGALSFIDSMVVGISTLMWSADIAAQEADEAPKTEEEAKKEEKQWNIMMAVTVVISLAFSVVVFMLLPYFLAGLMGKAGANDIVVNVSEALLRIVIFLLYMFLISRMKDIQRVFSYHGAEHKCINCIEHGLPLTVENVKKSSRQHKRCGTSFLLIVIIMSVVVFLILGIFNIQSHAMRLVIRLILIPIIAGFSYELLRYGGSHEGPVINTLVKPGLALQKLVTNEPDDEMCEVAIAAVNEVFDWKQWEEENMA